MSTIHRTTSILDSECRSLGCKTIGVCEGLVLVPGTKEGNKDPLARSDLLFFVRLLD